MNLRVLHLIRSVNPAGGGPIEGLAQITVATARRGLEVEVASLDSPSDPWVTQFPVKVRGLGPSRMVYGYSPKLIPWLRDHAREYAAIVIHGLWQFHGFAARRVFLKTKTPYLVFPHGMLDPWFKHNFPFKHLKKQLYWHLIEHSLLHNAHAVLFTTTEEARLAAATFRPYRIQPLILGYGISRPPVLTQTEVNEFLNTFPECRDKRLILYLARIHPKKGCDLLIDAFAKIAHIDPTAHLVMAGPAEGNLRGQLEVLARSLGIHDRITWTGMIQGGLKWGALRAAEVFALMSHQENFGVALVEALAIGLPVLTTYQVNIWETIVNEHAGFADHDTPAGATALLSKWWHLSEQERAVMRENSRNCFVNFFLIDAVAERLNDELQRIAA